MEAARQLERQTYRRGDGLHGGHLRQTGLRVLWALLYRGWGRAGACDPSLGQVAEVARCARSTVILALKRLETAGVLTRLRRGLVHGGRFVQVTNAYWFAPMTCWASETDLRQALESSVLTRRLWITEQQENAAATIGSVVEPLSDAQRQALAVKWELAMG
jgi:predicted transcriptional regulator